MMISLLCSGGNALADFSFSYFVYTTFHCTPVCTCKPIYHCLNKDYFIDVDEFLKFYISGNVMGGGDLRRQDKNINLIALN